MLPLCTHAGAARPHACLYLRHATARPCYCSSALSRMLLTCAHMLGVPTQVHTTIAYSRLSQARDRSCGLVSRQPGTTGTTG
eukprot:1351410-Pleurochrysis_carterae.AAC.1